MNKCQKITILAKLKMPHFEYKRQLLQIICLQTCFIIQDGFHIHKNYQSVLLNQTYEIKPIFEARLK